VKTTDRTRKEKSDWSYANGTASAGTTSIRVPYVCSLASTQL